jgi:hypothetical protein
LSNGSQQIIGDMLSNNNGRIFCAQDTWYLICYQFNIVYLLREISQQPILQDNVIDCFDCGGRQWYFTGKQGISLRIEEPRPDLLVNHNVLASLLTHPNTVQYLTRTILNWQQMDTPQYAIDSKDAFYEYFSYLTGRVPTLTGLTLTT